MSLKKRIISWLESLRFPVLLVIAVVLFALNVIIPDAIPFVDEILLALVAAILSRLKRRPRLPGPENEEGESGKD